ncbi:hypothetical protein M3A74_06720 [Corynebacterium appendicis]|uniref:hypothetical protein n=1 Tax=Corynebacterium appendicis TaxID=163202 RepID=UPI00223BBDD8|nr:hypothetical protein [Corynebacterium appendicis]MCT1684502.1 hypothetical protein [Corynebacterium appendicis]
MKWNAITLVAALLVLVAAAFAPMNPASTWVPRGAENTSGAPAAYSGADNLGNARRAAGDASAQAGFLTQGTSKLKDGTEELRDGSTELADGVSAAKDGADELSQGMVEIQAGTGQLADGATRLADNVGGAVDQVVGFDAIRGQVLAAIDDTLEGTRGSNDPDVKDLRSQLEDLRTQVDTAELPEDWTNQLTELKDGSRELANQLSTPGYAYHDGIYSATNGAADLAEGLGDMNDRIGEAKDGVNELADGAAKVDDMATNTKDRIGDVQRALPAAAPVAGAASGSAGGAGGTGATGEASISSSLPPLAAMLVSALAVLGGLAAALAAYGVTRSRWSILGLGTLLAAGAGTILVTILGTGLTPLAIALTGLALALGSLASAGITWILRDAFGELGGTAAAGIFALAQTGVVGWVWSHAATGDVDGIVRALSSAMPMHWSTSAISAAGNNGSTTAMWTGIGLSVLPAVLGIVAMRASRPSAVSALDEADSDYGSDDGDYGDDHYVADGEAVFDDRGDTAVLEAEDVIEHKR